MPTTASTRTTRSGALARRPRSAGRTGPSRFGRPSASPQRRPTGPATIVVRGRRKQQPTGLKGVLSSLSGKSASGKGRSSGAKGKGAAGGLALLAGVAGVAFKNRDKLSAKLGRSHDGQQDQPDSVDTMPPAAAAPVTPPPMTP